MGHTSFFWEEKTDRGMKRICYTYFDTIDSWASETGDRTGGHDTFAGGLVDILVRWNTAAGGRPMTVAPAPCGKAIDQLSVAKTPGTDGVSYRLGDGGEAFPDLASLQTALSVIANMAPVRQAEVDF